MSSANEIDNRFAPPSARVEDVAGPGLALAGRGARLVAAVIDGLLQGAVYFAIVYAINGRFTQLDPSFGSIALRLVAGLVLFTVLNGYFLATSGQTIGKKLLSLRIVRTDGSRASLGRLLGLRYLLGWLLAVIPVVGWIYAIADPLMIFRASHKCLHDNIADTIVIKA